MKKIAICQEELKRFQRENIAIEKKLKQLEGLDKIKTEFVSVVSHELRTPLSIIREIILILLQGIAGKVSSQQKGLLERAHANVERLGRLIDDLLDLSRLERGTFKLRYSLVNFKDLMLDSSDFFIKLAAQKSVVVKYVFPRSPVNIFLDTQRIQQVISNLVTNAIKFTDSRGKITVTVKLLVNKVRVRVSDSGIGIGTRDMNKLFVRFAQISSSAEVKKGLGLGLAISKEIIQRHGGEIWAESASGKGSEFYFTLPRYYSLEVFDSSAKARINDLLAQGQKVYLINITIINYNKLKNILPGHPYFAREIEALLRGALRSFVNLFDAQVQLVAADKARAEFSLLVPSADPRLVSRLHKYLKDQFYRYFKKTGVKNCFVNIGLLPYSSKDSGFAVKHVPASVHIRKISVGMDMRKTSRVEYQGEVQLFYPKKKVGVSRTIDISERGLCYISNVPLKTDTRITLKISLDVKKKAVPLVLHTSVAWIKAIEAAKRDGTMRYMVGLEFTRLQPGDNKVLSDFIRLQDAPQQ